jgi:hypothetical protein
VSYAKCRRSFSEHQMHHVASTGVHSVNMPRVRRKSKCPRGVRGWNVHSVNIR